MDFTNMEDYEDIIKDLETKLDKLTEEHQETLEKVEYLSERLELHEHSNIAHRVG